jgi:Na+/melibiose symporter-like transporter
LETDIKYGLISFAITSIIMLGTWPLVASTFGRISLETFWLNLIMVQLLGLFVLPFYLLTLVVSALSLGNPPFGILENGVFSLTELVV